MFLFLSFLLSPGRRTRRPPALSVPTSGSHCQSVTDSRCPALCRRNKGVPCWWSCPRRASAQSPRGRVPPICRHEVEAGVRGARHGRRGKGAAAPRQAVPVYSVDAAPHFHLPVAFPLQHHHSSVLLGPSMRLTGLRIHAPFKPKDAGFPPVPVPQLRRSPEKRRDRAERRSGHRNMVHTCCLLLMS